MMPFPMEIVSLVQKSDSQMKAGARAQAEASLLQAEALLEKAQASLTPQEEMILLAALAFQLRRLGNFRRAAELMERVCVLAVHLEPDSPATFGDFTDLADCYLRLGQTSEALAVYQRARPVCLRAWPVGLDSLDRKIKELEEVCRSRNLAMPPEIVSRCPSINYSIVHSGLPLFETLRVKNVSAAQLSHLALQVNIPGYSLPTQLKEFSLVPHEQKELAGQAEIRFVPDRLARQVERARSMVEINLNGQPVSQADVWILAYNECSHLPIHAAAMAAFVHPNNAAVRFLSRQMLDRFRAKTGQDTFLQVRQSQQASRIESIGHALYDCLCQQYHLKYDYEPPCWESTSQRVRFPDELLVGSTGTCLDWMFLLAAALESVLVGSPSQPVLLILSGEIHHALIGCWKDRPATRDIVIEDKDQIEAWIMSGALWVMETTGFTQGNPFWGKPVTYEACAAKGVELAHQAQRILGVNLAAARPDYALGRPGITPLPFRCEPPFGESALLAFWAARQAWQEAPTAQIQSTHLLRGLLHAQDSLVRKFFDQLSQTTQNPQVASAALDGLLAAGLKQIQQTNIGEPEESEGYRLARSMAIQEAQRLNASMVEDLHLLLALLRHPGVSVEKAFRQRRTSCAECLAFLEQLYPPQSTQNRSQFPSEVIEI
jgi:tetratricopeptide (TPR) repeat protein